MHEEFSVIRFHAADGPPIVPEIDFTYLKISLYLKMHRSSSNTIVSD